LFFIFGRRAVCIRALEPREIPSIFSLSQFSTPAGGLHKSSCSRRIRGAARGRRGVSRVGGGGGGGGGGGREVAGKVEKKCLARYLRNFLVTS